LERLRAQAPRLREFIYDAADDAPAPGSCFSASRSRASAAAAALAPKSPGPRGDATLQINEIKPGSAPPSPRQKPWSTTPLLYDTSAPDNKGKESISSRNAGAPFRFLVGTGSHQGMDQECSA